MNALEIRDEILAWLKHVPENGCWIPNPGERGVVIGLMNSALRLGGKMYEANGRRHQVLSYIFRDVLNKPWASAVSAKELSDEMWWALCQWVNGRKDADTGMWVGRDGLAEACVTCLREMETWEREQAGQVGFEL